jgi:hypothetical protein
MQAQPQKVASLSDFINSPNARKHSRSAVLEVTKNSNSHQEKNRGEDHSRNHAPFQ